MRSGRAITGVVFVLACSSSPPQSDAGADAGPDAGGTGIANAHTSSMAISADGSKVFVVNPDEDSISIVDVNGKTATEVLLASAHPVVDGSGAYTPAVMPRAIALSPDGATLYVTGERSGKLHVVDVASASAKGSVALCSEPIGLVLSANGASAFVSCSQDDSVVRVDTGAMSVAATAKVASEPWALSWSGDGSTLYTTHFMTAQLTAINPVSMTASAPVTIPDVAPRGDKRLAHGQPRGLYDLVNRPGTSELWTTLSLLGTDSAQPDLDFESTTFATLAITDMSGKFQRVLTIDAADIAGINGAFADIVSGPHAVAFTKDGAFAFMVDTNSEDILVVDAQKHVESSLVRPLPGHQPEGIVLSPDETHAYVQERNTNDVVVLDIARASGVVTVSVEPTVIPTITSDPMPTTMRFGQHLFYSANSDEYPITKNHWVACATCHMEGRSDAVTWRFAQGPRDTPTNAGGVLGTGLLFRTADRVQVEDYWRTVNIEQGGNFDDSQPQIQTLMSAIATYVNFGIPAPIPPVTNAQLVASGQAIFQQKCASCHSGPRFTDSSTSMDLANPVLHDVGTCVTNGPYNDVAHPDIDNDPRDACKFDTPSLTGVASTPPYFHDGSALTLADAATRMLLGTGQGTLSQEDMDALVEYLRSL
ncbi:MAG TPA: c-type cytochrome, partial [Polyangiaceae bacterium]